MEQIQKELSEWLKKQDEKGANLLKKLVQEGSVRGNESSAQAVIIEKCRELGLDVDIWEIGGEALLRHPAFCSDRKDFSGNPNVVGILRGTGGGKSMILNGHIDVVPTGYRKDWKHDPFSGHIEGGRLYGRGATDMKGGTVAMLLAVEAIMANNIKLRGDIIFQSVIEEESGGAGTLAAVLRGYRAEGALIPEPTKLKIFPKQQGSVWFRITVKGRSAHGGTRYEGVNAIEKAEIVLRSLRKLEERRNERVTDPLYDSVPIPIPINIGKIASGDWPSSVPDLALIEGRMGVAPQETIEEAQSEMEKFIARLALLDPWFEKYPPTVEWFGAKWLPGNLDTEHELVRTLAASYQAVKQRQPDVEASPWGTDGGVLSRIGDTPTVIFGPGTTEKAHDANEYIVLNDLFEAAEIIALTLVQWCELDE